MLPLQVPREPTPELRKAASSDTPYRHRGRRPTGLPSLGGRAQQRGPAEVIPSPAVQEEGKV